MSWDFGARRAVRATVNVYWDIARSVPSTLCALLPGAWARIPGGRDFSCSHFRKIDTWRVRQTGLTSQRQEASLGLLGWAFPTCFFLPEMGTISSVLSTDKGGYKTRMRHRCEKNGTVKQYVMLFLWLKNDEHQGPAAPSASVCGLSSCNW